MSTETITRTTGSLNADDLGKTITVGNGDGMVRGKLVKVEHQAAYTMTRQLRSLDDDALIGRPEIRLTLLAGGTEPVEVSYSRSRECEVGA